MRWQTKLYINNHTNINGLNFTVKRKCLSKWIIIQELTTYCMKEMTFKDANKLKVKVLLKIYNANTKKSKKAGVQY